MTEAASSPGETGQHVTLKVYFDGRIDALEKLVNARLEANATAVQAALRANQIAIDKAEQATEYRLALLNESRDALEDQTRLYITKAEFDGLRDATQTEIKSLQKIVYALTGALAVVQALLQFLAK